MRVLLDTNVLLRVGNQGDQSHPELKQTLRRLLASGDQLCVCSQNIVEFWVTATRPRDANGLGLGTTAARAAIDELLQSYQVLPDPEDLLIRWLGICQRLAVIGRQAYDARLIALMQAHGIEQLLTLNPVDFRRYGVSLITPTA